MRRSFPATLTWRDADNLTLDFGEDRVLYCYRTPDGTRYGASSQADALLLENYLEEDGLVKALLPGERWETTGTKPDLLPAVRWLFTDALRREAAGDDAIENHGIENHGIESDTYGKPHI